MRVTDERHGTSALGGETQQVRIVRVRLRLVAGLDHESVDATPSQLTQQDRRRGALDRVRPDRHQQRPRRPGLARLPAHCHRADVQLVKLSGERVGRVSRQHCHAVLDHAGHSDHIARPLAQGDWSCSHDHSSTTQQELLVPAHHEIGQCAQLTDHPLRTEIVEALECELMVPGRLRLRPLAAASLLDQVRRAARGVGVGDGT